MIKLYIKFGNFPKVVIMNKFDVEFFEKFNDKTDLKRVNAIKDELLNKSLTNLNHEIAILISKKEHSEKEEK